MESKNVMRIAKLILVLSFLCLLCTTIMYIRYRPFLTDPPEDYLTETQLYDFRQKTTSNNLETLHALAREKVDTWSSDAYLYSVNLTVFCEDFKTVQWAFFSFLKVNHLDIYPKQWQAYISLDLVEQEIYFRVEKEDEDPPPPLQKRITLSELKVTLPQVLQMAAQREIQGDKCQSLHISLYEDVWDIRYVDDPTYISKDRYPGFQINAITGEIK